MEIDGWLLLLKMPSLFKTHPRNYGKDKFPCRRCDNTHGVIHKYGLHMCRQCFRDNAFKIGFQKV